MDKKQDLSRLLDNYGSHLFKMAARLTLDETAAEEIMQDLFVRLIEIMDTQTINNLPAYARRIAINLAFDWRRKKRILLPISDERLESQAPPADLRLIQTEELGQILDAAQSLSGLTRECFVLRYVEQMEYARIAEQISKTVPQVRALCSKAIGQIRDILNRQNAPFYKEAINE